MSCRPKYLPKFQDAGVNLLKFEPRGVLLASAAADGTVRVWSMLSDCVVASSDLPTVATSLDWVESLSASPDLTIGFTHHTLVVGLNDGSVVRLRFELDPAHLPVQSTWSGRRAHRGHAVRAIATSPGTRGASVVTCGGEMVLWWAFEDDPGTFVS